jgi:glycosidase
MRKALTRPAIRLGVHGGDFEGIEQKLDYIKALGATAIWISPIVLNTEGQFHGYSAWNFYEVAPHWGSISNLAAPGAGGARARAAGD